MLCRFRVSYLPRNFFCFLLAGSIKTVSAQTYSADLTSSDWKVSATPFACSLTHSIPVFGKAIFAHKAGGGEVFFLESQGKVVFPAGTVMLETQPPVWRSDLVPLSLGSVIAAGGNQPIRHTSVQVAPLVVQLTAGVNVMYSSQPVVTAPSRSLVMRVVLNAKNFNEGYKRYQQCVADIIPYSFAQIARTFINYGENPEGLTSKNKADLKKVVRYIKADSKVVGVFVDGHSDNSGTAAENEVRSKQAAEWVAAYLTEQGVAADKITTRWHGDKFVIANNKVAPGRAQNRRVTVRLEDEAAHKEFMKKEEEKRKADEKVIAEKAIADAKLAEASTSSSLSSRARMTPEEISRMVQGYDSTKPK